MEQKQNKEAEIWQYKNPASSVIYLLVKLCYFLLLGSLNGEQKLGLNRTLHC